MSESIRDLAGWYPLLPNGTTIPDAAKNILDMRVHAMLDPGDFTIHGSGATAVSVARAFLTGMSSSSATVVVRSLPSRWMWDVDSVETTYTIPVYVGRDAVPPPGEPYVVCAATPAAVTFDPPYEIHPDCLVIMQRSPSLWFMLRGPVSSTDAQPTAAGRIDGRVDPLPTAATLSKLSFEDGFNVSVSGSESSLVFTGNAGAGAGVWTVSPFNDVQAWNTRPGRGLRSINGQTGAIMLEGSPSVNLSVHESIEVSGQQVIYVDLQPLKVED